MKKIKEYNVSLTISYLVTIKTENKEKASVKLRFRVMTEVMAEGNLSNPKRYPEILDDSLNFLFPIYSNEEEKSIIDNFNLVFSKKEQKNLKFLRLNTTLMAIS